MENLPYVHKKKSSMSDQEQSNDTPFSEWIDGGDDVRRARVGTSVFTEEWLRENINTIGIEGNEVIIGNDDVCGAAAIASLPDDIPENFPQRMAIFANILRSISALFHEASSKDKDTERIASENRKQEELAREKKEASRRRANGPKRGLAK